MSQNDRRRSVSPQVERLETRELLSAPPLPTIPQHYSYIRIAQLAFDGTPLDSTTTQLLQNSVDLVVSGLTELGPIAAIAPNTPQLIYTNTSSLYLNLLTAWMNYAYSNGVNPEVAFYHVAQPTAFSGNSPSSQPVDWFWGVYQSGSSWTNVTSQAHGSGGGGVAFPAPGGSLAVGYPDPFREIDISLTTPAGAGWAYVLEYPTAVDASGNPTAWGTITTTTDTTAGLTQSGQITFDPPSDWVPASVGGSAPLYYMRLVAAGAGTAPVASTILGSDYVGAHGGTSGVIPVFDYAADTDGDGYLNNAEWANRTPGDNARFAYQSRLFAPGYGQMRFETNPANPAFQAFAAAYEKSYLASYPQAAGLFLDNSSGDPPAAPGSVIEPVANYSSDYASLVQTVDQAIGPQWIMANTAGSPTHADGVIQNVQAVYEESTLAPLASTYVQFQAEAANVAHWESLASPSRYLVLDSTPAGGSPTDPRTQLATLAEYYLLGSPVNTFLDFYGGYSPATSWSQHWSPAVNYNVGQPLGTWSVAATGQDPSNPSLTYNVYERSYSNALVLYKPLSYGNGVAGSLTDASATTIRLHGLYRPLQADGTLGRPVRSIKLRNGEGAILVKA
jgi:hypothetical protein